MCEMMWRVGEKGDCKGEEMMEEAKIGAEERSPMMTDTRRWCWKPR